MPAPRIRTHKPELPRDSRVAAVSISARYLWLMMWCYCDDRGVHPDDARNLKMEVFPGDDITSANVAEMVDELVANGLLRRFTHPDHDDRTFLFVPGWKTHQKIDRPSKTYIWPEPPAKTGALSSKAREDSRALDADLDQDQDQDQDQGSGKESRSKTEPLPESPRSTSAGTPSRKRATATAKLPSDWKPSPEQVAYGVNIGFNEAQVKAIAITYRAYWTQGKGRTISRNSRGWDQTWINWITKDAKHEGVFGRPKQTGNSRPLSPFHSMNP